MNQMEKMGLLFVITSAPHLTITPLIDHKWLVILGGALFLGGKVLSSCKSKPPQTREGSE